MPTIVRRIKAAGFVIVGKSNAPENGWSLATEPRLYGATRNPWRADVTPGGSSGGSRSGRGTRGWCQLPRLATAPDRSVYPRHVAV